MNPSDPRSWPDKLMGLCLGFLFGTIALYVGVQLIASVWHILLITIAAISTVMFIIAVIRYRNRRW
jgi:hypothetical protein